MQHKRVLAIHDISCVGKCSLTVAIPIISSVGIECSVLPTAILSTHTGGFVGYTYKDLANDIIPIINHWSTLGIKFDAIYTGFIGSLRQINLIGKLIDKISCKNIKVYIDPVMGDVGKLYNIFDKKFPKEMKNLCKKANIIMPNLTELSLMLGIECGSELCTHQYIDTLIEESKVFNVNQIIVTSVSYKSGETGVVYFDYDTGKYGEIMHDQIPGYYYGVGDIFGSAFVGAYESNLSLDNAISTAIKLTVNSIKRTYNTNMDARYGVSFEPELYNYIIDIRSKNNDNLSQQI